MATANTGEFHAVQKEVSDGRDNVATYSQSSIELYYLLDALNPELRKSFIYQIKRLLSGE